MKYLSDTLRRNDRKKPLIKLGPYRNWKSIYEWHTPECMIEDYGVNPRTHDRSLWCATHGQWIIERPIKITYEFADGVKGE